MFDIICEFNKFIPCPIFPCVPSSDKSVSRIVGRVHRKRLSPPGSAG